MTLKQFFLTMLLATVAVWLVWIFILFRIDPTKSDWSDFLFFYSTFLVAGVGTLTIMGTVVRRKFKPQDLVSRQVLISFRQSIWFSLILFFSLFLLSQELFRFWIIALIILFFTFMELIFINLHRSSRC